MAFSSFNGIALCNMVTINGLSRASSNQILGQTQGVSCTREPIVTDGPAVDIDTICTDVLDREPSGPVKYTTVGEPGGLSVRSVLTDTDAACGANKLTPGWYVFFGADALCQ